jgi:hypothetical protein
MYLNIATTTNSKQKAAMAITCNSGPERGGTHVLLLPLPVQGHTNLMLQFGRRLAYHGLRPTLLTM